MHDHRINPAYGQRGARRSSGAAYVLALLVTTLLASMTLVFAREMRVEAYSANNRVSQTQAHWIALGALDAIRGELALSIERGDPPRIENFSAEAQVVGDGLFWLVRPDPLDDTQLSFGLQSESGRINLSAAGQLRLLELPGMTEEIIASATDWQDRNDNTSPGGAEAAYYLSRDTPYEIKNRRFETVGEMLYIRGMTPELFYGEDTNRSGKLEANEADASVNAPDDNGDANLDRGFVDHFTVYSLDPAVSDSGVERVTLDIKQSPQQLGQLRNFLISQLGEERGTELAQLSFNKTATAGKNETYLSVLEFYVETRATEEEFELVHDGLKRLDNIEERRGMIDVYHASAAVLDTVPGLEPGDGELIVAARPTFEPGEPIGNLTWLIDAVGEQKAITAARFLTHRSYQFTADIVAVSGDGRGFCRLRAVIDCRPVLEGDADLPLVLLVQDLTHLGWPLEDTIREELRRGATPQEIADVYAEGEFE